MTTYVHDNRWSPGASQAELPEDSPAMYSARWIDNGSRADIVPDRQGFAYNDQADRDRLIAHLEAASVHTDLGWLTNERDIPVHVAGEHKWQMWLRRSGGYVYVDAWLTP